MSGQIPINSLPAPILYTIFKQTSVANDPTLLMLVCKHWHNTYLQQEWKETNTKGWSSIKNFELENCAGHYKGEFLAIAREIQVKTNRMFQKQSILILKEYVLPILKRFGCSPSDPNTLKKLQRQIQALYMRFVEILRIDQRHKGMWTTGIPKGIKLKIWGTLLFQQPISIRICQNWNRAFHYYFQHMWEQMRQDSNLSFCVQQLLSDLENYYPQEQGFGLFRKFFCHYPRPILFVHMSQPMLRQSMIDAIHKSKDEDLCLFWKGQIHDQLKFNFLIEKASIIREILSYQHIQDKLKKIEQVKIYVGLIKFGDDMQSIPPEILYLENLTTLEVCCTTTHIHSLPFELWSLTRLKHLELRGMGLSILPKWISNLIHLESLNLTRNKLSDIPVEIGKLKKLTYLNLSFNCLGNWPASLNLLKNLKTFQATYADLNSIDLANFSEMQTLDLSGNFEIVSLPFQIAHLTKLEFLNLSNTGVTLLPPQMCHLTNMKIIKLQNTPLKSIPNLLTLQKLQSLNLEQTHHFNLFNLKISAQTVIRSSHSAQWLERCQQIKEKTCLTILGDLFKLASLYSANDLCPLNMKQKVSSVVSHFQKKIAHAFKSLKKEDRTLFYQTISRISNRQHNQRAWGKEHLFDNKNVFLYTMRQVARRQFEQLHEEEQRFVAEIVYAKAGYPQTNNFARWKEKNLFKDLLRFYNALAGV